MYQMYFRQPQLNQTNLQLKFTLKLLHQIYIFPQRTQEPLGILASMENLPGQNLSHYQRSELKLRSNERLLRHSTTEIHARKPQNINIK